MSSVTIVGSCCFHKVILLFELILQVDVFSFGMLAYYVVSMKRPLWKLEGHEADRAIMVGKRPEQTLKVCPKIVFYVYRTQLFENVLLRMLVIPYSILNIKH